MGVVISVLICHICFFKDVAFKNQTFNPEILVLTGPFPSGQADVVVLLEIFLDCKGFSAFVKSSLF